MAKSRAKQMVYTLRVSVEDRARWEREAKRDGRKLSSFVTLVMNQRVARAVGERLAAVRK